MIRPAYSGKLMAQIVKTSIGPWMMTIRPHSFKPITVELKPALQRACPQIEPKASGIVLLDTRHKTATEDIRDSKILISGGGGVSDHFDRLSELAEVLNAQVSASRRIVDSGVAHRKIQVGQSGKTVSPKLYIALGISGSVQHIEGLKNVETILAVNTNKHAPICSLAALVVEGDAVDFIDKLILKIKNPV
jgi:electron transfer flavoprotein alpha subunit